MHGFRRDLWNYNLLTLRKYKLLKSKKTVIQIFYGLKHNANGDSVAIFW